LQDATQFIPPAVFSRASRITFSLAATRKPIWNLVVSNVPVMSYCGRLDVGIVADREQMRDVWMLIDWLGESLDELLPERPRSATTGRRAAAAK